MYSMVLQWSPLNKTTLGRGLSGFVNRLVLLTVVLLSGDHFITEDEESLGRNLARF